MKRKRFTEGQITVLREQGAGPKTGYLARKYGVSEAALYDCDAKYGCMDAAGNDAASVLSRCTRASAARFA